jgi:Holliday junction DNA helicase RuvA
MIVFVEGVLERKAATCAVINAAGVGYELLITVNAFEVLPPVGDHVRLYTYHAVRDDAEVLYGFASQTERTMFEMLIGVSSIGPALAINVLSGLPVDSLRAAIAEGDVTRLARIKGIGKKTAERLVLELRERVGALPSRPKEGPAVPGDIRDDAVRALVALGYQEREAHTTVAQILKDTDAQLTVEDVVRRSLGAFQ